MILWESHKQNNDIKGDPYTFMSAYDSQVI